MELPNTPQTIRDSLFYDIPETYGKSVKFTKRQNLFLQGEPVIGLFLVNDGLVKVSQKNEQGQLIFARLVLPGDTVGHRSIFIQKFYSGTSEVISDFVQVRFYTLEEVSKLLATREDFARKLIFKIATELQQTERQRFEAKQKTTRQRLVELLLSLVENYAVKNKDGSILIKSEVAKNNIAKFLFVADETVIRLMAEMKKEGLLDYEGRCILIKNIAQFKVELG